MNPKLITSPITWISLNQKRFTQRRKDFFSLGSFAPLRAKFSCSTCKNFIVQVLKIVWTLCLLLPIRPALAHGGGELQIGNAPIGNYLVSVWNNPPTARAERTIHVTVGVAQAGSGAPVLDATVMVLILNDRAETVATAPATTEQSVNRLFYEADLPGVPEGVYEMQVMVTGSQGGGEIAFPLVVEPVLLWPWLGGIVAAGGAVWLVLRYWRQTAVTAPRRKTAVPHPRSVD
jgi:hypothetical protein